MSFLEKNKKILLGHYAGLFEEITAGDDDDFSAEDIKIETAQTGDPTFCVKGIFIHSKHDPVREGQRLAESVRAENGPIVILGFGLGYAAQAAAKLGRPVIIAEKHKSLLLKALELRDFSDFLSKNRVLFIVGGTGEGIASAVKIAAGFLFESAAKQNDDKKPSVIRNKALTSLDEPWYKAMDERIRVWASKDDVNQATHKRFGRRWVRSFSRNMSAIRDIPGVSRLEQLAKNNQTFGLEQRALPVFLAAAGPSLDKIKPMLRDIHDRCIIVAADTCLRFFLQNGIQPDFTVVVDPQFWNSRHLDRCAGNFVARSAAPDGCGGGLRTALIAEPAVYPSVLTLPFKNKFICSSMFPLGAFVENQVDPKGKLAAGGSVATSAWDFARLLGSNEIWIAGLDLSFPGFKTHFRSARFEALSNSNSSRFNPVEKWVVRALRDGFPFKARSADGGQVLTDKRLSLYAAWFESQFRQYPQVRNYSLFQEGIYIEGLQSAETEKFLALPVCRGEIDKRIDAAFSKIESDFNSPQEKQKRSERYKNAVSELISGLDNLKSEAAKGAEIVHAALDSDLSLSEQDRIYKELEAITRFVMESKFKEITDFMLMFADGENEAEGMPYGGNPFYGYLKKNLSLYSGVIKAVEYYSCCGFDKAISKSFF